jgi:hypothetical protein
MTENTPGSITARGSMSLQHANYTHCKGVKAMVGRYGTTALVFGDRLADADNMNLQAAHESHVRPVLVTSSLRPPGQQIRQAKAHQRGPRSPCTPPPPPSE